MKIRKGPVKFIYKFRVINPVLEVILMETSEHNARRDALELIWILIY